MAEIIKASWREGLGSFYKGIDAQKVYEEIGSDSATPEEVLAKAENENSELHKCFTWDDDEASRKWRLHEARRIIQTLVIKVEETEIQPKKEFRLFQPTSTMNEYKPVQFFQRNQDEYEKLLDRAKNELAIFKRRYQEIAELEEVIKAIDSVI